MATLDYSNLLKITKMFKENKTPYTITRVNNSFKIESEAYNGGFSNKGINPTELGFVRRIRNYVLKNDIDLKFIDPIFTRDIHYVGYNLDKLSNGVKYDNVVEIDLDQAYWEMAYKLGVISDENYEYGSKLNDKISKKGRLIALGSLAKKTHIYDFDGEKLIKETIEEPTLRNVFLTICKEVGDIVNSLKNELGSDYLYHWVDAVFIENKITAVKKVEEVFRKHGFHFKKIPLQYIEVKNDVIHALEFDKEESEAKTYRLPTKEQIVSFYDLERINTLISNL